MPYKSTPLAISMKLLTLWVAKITQLKKFDSPQYKQTSSSKGLFFHFFCAVFIRQDKWLVVITKDYGIYDCVVLGFFFFLEKGFITGKENENSQGVQFHVSNNKAVLLCKMINRSCNCIGDNQP